MEVPEALLAANQTAATVADAWYWERLCPHLTVSVKGRRDSGDGDGDGNAPGSGASAASDGETAAAEKDRSRGAGNALHPNANAELALL